MIKLQDSAIGLVRRFRLIYIFFFFNSTLLKGMKRDVINGALGYSVIYILRVMLRYYAPDTKFLSLEKKKKRRTI